MTRNQLGGAVTESRGPSFYRMLRGAPITGLSASMTGGAR